MKKSTASSQTQKPSAGRRARRIPSTPTTDIMTPPPTQSMASPESGTFQPTETSVSSTYLRILGDVMGQFVPSEQMSEIFSNLAKKIKEEESRVACIPIGTPVGGKVPTESAAQPLNTSTSIQIQTLMSEMPITADDLEQKVEIEEGVESDEEGQNQEKKETGGGEERTIRQSVGKESAEKGLEVVNVEEMELEDGRETLSERTRRRNPRAQRGLNREELRNMREEAAVLAAAKREAAERRRKGKQVATPSKSRKSRPASLGIVIREAACNIPILEELEIRN